MNQLTPGTRIDHDRYGIGVVSLVNLTTVEVIFERGGRMELSKANLQAKILNQPESQINTGPQIDVDQLAAAIEEVLDRFGGLQKPIELGRKWEGGTLLLQPANTSLKPKEIPIEIFFHKIVMARDRLRVLEQNINSHPVLTDEEKINLQQYITRIYGSFTTFNVLFENKTDYFSGEKTD